MSQCPKVTGTHEKTLQVVQKPEHEPPLQNRTSAHKQHANSMHRPRKQSSEQTIKEREKRPLATTFGARSPPAFLQELVAASTSLLLLTKQRDCGQRPIQLHVQDASPAAATKPTPAPALKRSTAQTIALRLREAYSPSVLTKKYIHLHTFS
jgi:hypothetical protein